MNPLDRPVRVNLPGRYAVLFVIVSAWSVAAQYALVSQWLPAWARWVAAIVSGLGAVWLTWRLLTDTTELSAAKKAATWGAGSLMLAGLVVTGGFLAKNQVSTSSAVMVVTGVMLAVSWVFVGLLALVEWLLKWPWTPLSVARTVIREAISQRVVVALFALLMLIVPILPFVLSADQPLRYRVQQFLGYSMAATLFGLALFTLTFACWTLSSELRDKQVYTALVKPISRGQFLLGKWLGLVLLNGVLLLVVGLGIGGFTRFYLAELPAQDAWDALAVREEVLTARIKQEPRPAKPFDQQVAERVGAMLKTPAGRSTLIDLGRTVASEQGAVQLGDDLLLDLGAERATEQLLQQAAQEWRSLGPSGTSSFAQTYIFEGLERAADYGDVLYLRYKIKGTTGNRTLLGIEINGRRQPPFEAALNITQRLPVPAAAVDPDGRLALVLYNLNPNDSITFPAEDGLAMLYRVGGFGANFTRAMLMIWLKLAFVAALGLTVATFLGFAVALLTGMLVLIGAQFSGTILESLRYTNQVGPEQVMDYLGMGLRLIAQLFTMPLSKFSAFSPVEPVVDGLYLGWTTVGRCALWIGLVWTGAVALAAWVIFGRRELARVQV